MICLLHYFFIYHESICAVRDYHDDWYFKWFLTCLAKKFYLRDTILNFSFIYFFLYFFEFTSKKKMKELTQILHFSVSERLVYEVRQKCRSLEGKWNVLCVLLLVATPKGLSGGTDTPLICTCCWRAKPIICMHLCSQNNNE